MRLSPPNTRDSSVFTPRISSEPVLGAGPLWRGALRAGQDAGRVQRGSPAPEEGWRHSGSPAASAIQPGLGPHRPGTQAPTSTEQRAEGFLHRDARKSDAGAGGELSEWRCRLPSEGHGGRVLGVDVACTWRAVRVSRTLSLTRGATHAHRKLSLGNWFPATRAGTKGGGRGTSTPCNYHLAYDMSIL